MKKEDHKKKKKTTRKYQSFRLQRKKDRPVKARIVTVRRVLVETFQLFKKEWKLFTGLGILYAVSYRLLVEGVGRLDLNSVKDALDSTGAASDRAIETLVLTGTAFNASSSTTTPQASLLGGFLTLVFALCTIWAARYAMANEKIRIRDALYNGPAPLLSTLIVLLVISLQTLPLTLGVFLYGSATASGLATTGVENMMLFVVAALLTILTCYWLSSSLIAFVAVTLPGMYPLGAMRAARKLVHFRRWQTFMRIAIFALILGIFWLLVIVGTVSNPLTILVVTEIIDILRAVTLILSAVFLYKLYRTLVDEPVEEE